MSIDPSQAPSMRANAARLLPSSTTAMFIGTPISAAFKRAAWTTASAACSVTPADGASVVAMDCSLLVAPRSVPERA